jgi:hypothetical protein
LGCKLATQASAITRPIQSCVAASDLSDTRPICRVDERCIDLKRPTRFRQVARTVDGRDRRPRRDRPATRFERDPELDPADPATRFPPDLAIRNLRTARPIAGNPLAIRDPLTFD